MAEKVTTNVAPSLSTCANCHKILPDECYTCRTCTDIVLCSEACALKHARAIHIVRQPALNPMNCVICDGEPEAVCSVGTCKAPVCNHVTGQRHETCRKIHETKHFERRCEEDSYHCSGKADHQCCRCEAWLCHQWACQEKHDKYCYTKTEDDGVETEDVDADAERINAIIEEIDRDP